MAEKTFEKLKETIPSDGVKIIELYNKIDNGILNVQPNYQRKLVWKKQHKYAFIETILLNFPFPEVYIASSDIDVENMIASEVVVDGQQRLTTIVEYIKGEGDFKNQDRITPFCKLLADEKKEFLNYKVSVKDLKEIGEKLIKEIFQRINSTEYSLNTVEKNNAQFGDGEIAIFCKQLVESNYNPTKGETDIIIDTSARELIIDFFIQNEIFTENDKKRMYDFQYMMLLTATILDGSYFGRSTRVDYYLEKYNSAFDNYTDILDSLSMAITVISKLGFSKKSYWYNKANLFTILIELSKINIQDLDLEKLEVELLSLEDKVDIYFNAEDEDEMVGITEDERKYFEVARHGSHEKAARDHRGKVIYELFSRCLNTPNTKPESYSNRNITLLQLHEINFVTIIPTDTGLNKSIMDATLSVRDFLKKNGIHDYSTQENGPIYKISKKAKYILNEELKELNISLYKATKRGDTRIWLSDLGNNAKANDLIAITIYEAEIYIINLSDQDLNNSKQFKAIFNIK